MILRLYDLDNLVGINDFIPENIEKDKKNHLLHWI